MTQPTIDAPSSWRLTSEEIASLAQDAIGDPVKDGNEWRPDGGSFHGGIGQCLYDEIKGIWDLIILLKQINDDIDLAADGIDNYEIFRSRGQDFGQVLRIFTQLNSQTLLFASLPREQQLALFRVYAKLAKVRQVLNQIAKAGLNMIAAYDLYWNTEYEVFTFSQGENVLKALADVVSLFFTDEEWTAMAEGGKALADQLTTLIKQKVETDPWGTSGYVACMVALFFSPTKLVRALRPVMRAFGGIGKMSGVGDMAKILRANKIEVPVWLGGRKADVPDAPKTTDAPTVEQPASRADANPKRSENPDDHKVDEPDGETTEIAETPAQREARRKKDMGDAAEADARKRLQDQGFKEEDIYSIENASHQGTDIVAIDNGPPPRVKVIEVKSGTADLNAGQQAGGELHFGDVLRRVRSDPSSFKNGQIILDRLATLNRQGLDFDAFDYEIWKYDRFDPYTPDSVGIPAKTDWTPGTKTGEFILDADGNPLWGPSGKRRRTAPRDYTTVE